MQFKVSVMIFAWVGVYTGAIYKDLVLKKVFPGEGRTDKTVIAIKTHLREVPNKYERVILVVRHPFNCTLAEFKRRNRGHTGEVPDSIFNGELNPSNLNQLND